VVSSLGLRWWVTRTLWFFLRAVLGLPTLVVASPELDFLLAARAAWGRALRLKAKHKAKRAFLEEQRA
jgi:hypothetical protein